MNAITLFEHFSVIKDPRQIWKINHTLSDILLLTVCGVISGCEGWEEIEYFGVDHLDWLKKYGDFNCGIPVHDTIARVISQINPKQFQRCFIDWMASCHDKTEGEIIAIDGKTVRGSYDKSARRGAIHMVSAFSAANEVSLGQVKTEEKSNEITAIPELLKLLEIKGCLITLDAMGCQREIAQTIVERGADYLLAVKGNQKRLKAALEKCFSSDNLTQFKGDTFSEQEKSHGRLETRLHLVSTISDDFDEVKNDWVGIKTVGAAVCYRQVEGKPVKEPYIRYYISSAVLTAKQFAHAVRSHWSVENQLHWKLDVAMKEDNSRIRRGKAAEVLSGVRHVALNLLNAETSFKAGIKRKQKKAARNSSYLTLVLAGKGAS